MTGRSAATPRVARPSAAVAIGNALFHHRNALFPASFIVVALVSRPRMFLGTARGDGWLDAAGFAIAAAGQLLRAVVIGLAYIRRGGKDRRIHADALVQDGIFAHSRNPLYVGNMAIYLGLFLILNSVLGYVVGVPFFLGAYLCITLAEEDFLRREFGMAYVEYCRRVPRYIPNLAGLQRTLRSMRFDWRRLVRKEYGATFAWLTTALALVYWEGVWNRDVTSTRGRLVVVLALWLPVLVSYAVARVLKKSGRLRAVRD